MNSFLHHYPTSIATTMHCMHALKHSVSITEFWSMWSGWKFTNLPIHRLSSAIKVYIRVQVHADTTQVLCLVTMVPSDWFMWLVTHCWVFHSKCMEWFLRSISAHWKFLMEEKNEMTIIQCLQTYSQVCLLNSWNIWCRNTQLFMHSHLQCHEFHARANLSKTEFLHCEL